MNNNGKIMLELAIVTDEIDADIRRAIDLGTSWGIEKYEIRCIGPNRIPAVPDADLALLAQLKDDHNITYTALSPGIFKLPISQAKGLESEVDEVLPRTIDVAGKLDIDTIIVFGFQKDKETRSDQRDAVLGFLTKAERLAKSSDVRILVENEPGFWCDTGANTARLLSELNSPFVRANWDPANAIGTGEKPYPDGYEALKDFIGNVHAKDTDSHALERCVAIGEGLVDWEGQIRALIRDRLVSHITIETHVQPLVEKSMQNIKTLKHYISSATD
jgi:sugar phosphate isomerase/epimerase